VERTIRILAIDVGAGTQDIVLYESDRPPETCIKLVLPAQSQVVAARIRHVTALGRPLFLAGSLMGGGASSEAVLAHLEAGLPVYAAPEPARTLHNDLDRIRALGVELREDPPPGAEIVWLGDVDLASLRHALQGFEVRLPSICAVAVQDHGYLPDAAGREFRYEFLQGLLARSGHLRDMVYRDPPAYMIRMRATRRLVPGCVVMDTGAAAVLGSLCDPQVARAAEDTGAVLVNIGTMHTFGVAVRGQRVFGLFEHHTAGLTASVLAHLVERLQQGRLTHEEVTASGGHGAAFDPAYGRVGHFDFVAVTGPNRWLARGLGYYQAAPFGDMMLTGAFGLVEGTLRLLEREGVAPRLPSLVDLARSSA
jgi:uncharacterized protein (DUF1786 family)